MSLEERFVLICNNPISVAHICDLYKVEHLSKTQSEIYSLSKRKTTPDNSKWY